MAKEKITPILRPDGPDRADTSDLIATLQSAVRPTSDPEVRRYVKGIIESLKEGYRIQAGKKY